MTDRFSFLSFYIFFVNDEMYCLKSAAADKCSYQIDKWSIEEN